MVTLTIDGQEVSVPKGTLVIRAAEQIGTYIPRFCDHPHLDPLGACRQCLVEVEGQRKPLTACTTTVTDGMVVKTQVSSELAADAQEGVLELLLINHPLDCPMCDKGGECPLQDQALAYGPGGSRYIDPKRRFTKPVPINPLVRLDRERCVLCARCTRFASEISGDPFIELFERGALEQVAIFEDEPYDSLFSGNVIQICPVGALTSETFRFRARPFDMTTTPSTCNRCASGCSIDVQERRGSLVRLLARNDDAVNDEWLCDKGRFGFAYASSNDRITEPLVRKGDDFVAVSWSEALDAAVAGVRAASGAAVLGGANLTVEDSYALSRFARTVLQTNDVDFRTYAGTEEEERLLVAVAHSETATNADIDAASTIVIAGSDLKNESPILYLRVRKAVRKRGARVIEVGPRRTFTHRGEAQWIATPPGGEAAALAGLELGEGAVMLAGERLVHSPGALTAAWNLGARAGARFAWVPRKAGARGAIEAGLHPAMLPGGRSVRWAKSRDEVGATWGLPVPEAGGVDAATFLGNGGGRALWLAGADPVRDMGASLDGFAFVVAQDVCLNDSVRRADVVLPAATGYERAGTLLNWEGRARTIAGVVPPAGVSLPDHEILASAADAFGVRGFPRTLAELHREIRALRPEMRAIEPLPEPQAPERREGLALVAYPQLLDDGTMMTGAEQLNASAPAWHVDIHSTDADGVVTGDRVRVKTARGQIEGRARVSADRVAPGAVAVPHHVARALGATGEPVTVTKA